MSFYIDIHTHHHKPDNSSIIQVQAICDFDSPLPELKKQNYFCLGVHPWLSEKTNWEKAKSKITMASQQSQFLGIGECGLDRVYAKNKSFKKEIDPNCWSIQLKLFKNHLDLAKHLGVKLIIIHSVKAHQEILEQVKKSKYQGYLLFHDYNGSPKETNQIVSKGHYISLGKRILNKQSKVYYSLSFIPLSQLFCETDDHELPIQDIYKKLSQSLGLTKSQLRDQLYQNFLNLLKKTKNC